jgi:phosphoribosylformylglycinamidine (FGAM) synthase-like amidotransferase family enzyme
LMIVLSEFQCPWTAIQMSSRSIWFAEVKRQSLAPIQIADHHGWSGE